MADFTRRELLARAAAAPLLLPILSIGCGDDATPGEDPPDAPPGGADAPPRLDATPQCEEGPTEDQIEGPFYKEGAPERSVLVADGDPGVRLSVSGRVLDVACAVLGGALLDVWQANDAGAYDTAGFAFRGKLHADAGGSYRFDTIIPGRYLNGDTYRPAHLHLKVSAPGYTLLTTQLYFEGDPFNDVDPFLHPSLVMPLTDAPAGGKQATFDFVLVPS